MINSSHNSYGKRAFRNALRRAQSPTAWLGSLRSQPTGRFAPSIPLLSLPTPTPLCPLPPPAPLCPTHPSLPTLPSLCPIHPSLPFPPPLPTPIPSASVNPSPSLSTLPSLCPTHTLSTSDCADGSVGWMSEPSSPSTALSIRIMIFELHLKEHNHNSHWGQVHLILKISSNSFYSHHLDLCVVSELRNQTFRVQTRVQV